MDYRQSLAAYKSSLQVEIVAGSFSNRPRGLTRYQGELCHFPASVSPNAVCESHISDSNFLSPMARKPDRTKVCGGCKPLSSFRKLCFLMVVSRASWNIFPPYTLNLKPLNNVSPHAMLAPSKVSEEPGLQSTTRPIRV